MLEMMLEKSRFVRGWIWKSNKTETATGCGIARRMLECYKYIEEREKLVHAFLHCA